MNTPELIIIGLILFAGSVLQGAAGFAFGLFGIPLLVWAGVSLSEAVAIISVSIFIQVLVGSYQLRAYIHWREILAATALRYLTLPLGLWLLIWVETLGQARVKQVLGGILLAVLAVQIFWRVKPREKLHPGWLYLAFSTSGVLQGMVAMGGPPVVLWVMAHRWTSQETRAFLQALFLMVAPVQILLLYFSTGPKIASALGSGFAYTPVVAAGSFVGVWLGNLIAKPRLRQMAFGILFITAVMSIVSP